VSTGDPHRLPCAGCGAEDAGLDRLAYRHEPHCSKFDAFYDASDDELAAMVPPRPGGSAPVCLARYERPGGRERGDRIVRCHLSADHSGEHEEADTEVKWWGEHTPGKGWERLRTELPGLAPDLTEEDMRKADAILADTPRRCASRIAHETGVVLQCILGTGHATPQHRSGQLGAAHWFDEDDRVIADRDLNGGHGGSAPAQGGTDV
jgi:hypothetical protein